MTEEVKIYIALCHCFISLKWVSKGLGTKKCLSIIWIVASFLAENFFFFSLANVSEISCEYGAPNHYFSNDDFDLTN